MQINYVNDCEIVACLWIIIILAINAYKINSRAVSAFL